LLLLVAPGIIQNQRNQNIEQAAQINADNTATAMAATANAIPQSTATSVSTAFPTGTAVVSIIVTNTPVVSGDVLSADEQATVQALQAEVGGASGTQSAAATATALPTTGFADEYGLPGLVGLAVILIAVVFLSRKLRTSAH
jgi:LPXTG-motif cell wall-anchored protein